MKTFLAIALALTCLTCRGAEPIRILAWNIESGGSDTAVIIDQLKTQMPKYDIVALSEVPSNALEPIAKSLGWKHFGGSRGGEDRLMIAWSDRFESNLKFEIRSVYGKDMPGGNNRVPLVVALKEKATSLEFWLINNHLTRGNEDNRNLQAKLLADYIGTEGSVTPLIAVGDFNMDYDFKTKKGNAAFDIIQKDGHWKWIEPKELIDTNWADPDGDGKDNDPDSMLDFVFVNQAAQKWKISCEVVVREGDFPDDKKTSYHRPVLVTLSASQPPDEFTPQELSGTVAEQFEKELRSLDSTYIIKSIGYSPKSDRFNLELEWLWIRTVTDENGVSQKVTTKRRLRSLIFDSVEEGTYKAQLRRGQENIEVIVKLATPPESKK